MNIIIVRVPVLNGAENKEWASEVSPTPCNIIIIQ